jgi:hypothetical protein
VTNHTINSELNKLLSRISTVVGGAVACYEEGQPWATENVARAIEEYTEEIDLVAVLEGRLKPSGILILCMFKSDRREDGSNIVRLFEFSARASERIRSVGKANSSHGELFSDLLQ